ncbi:hypothetical protein [Actinocorallia aurantiaca]|uniref:Uncharacterized protein n=1 Tax=Actinocorallia aurantiaca TaxID=46204 RepID=A0ABP6H2V4_9ACTN
MTAPDSREVGMDVPPLDGLPPAADAAPLAVPDQHPPVSGPRPDVAPTEGDKDAKGDAEEEQDAPTGLPVGQLAAGGASVVTVAGTVLYQTTGALGLAAGGLVTAASGVAYLRRRRDNRDGGRRQEKTRTVKTTQTAHRTPAGSRGLLGGGRGGRSGGRTSSRTPGLLGRSGGGRQGGRALWPSRSANPSGSGSARSILGGRSATGSRRSSAPTSAGASARGRAARAGKPVASDGGGSALRLPTRKNTKTPAPAIPKSAAAAKGGRTSTKEAKVKDTPTAAKTADKKTGKDPVSTPVSAKKTPATPSSRFSRWASWWAEDQPGPVSSRTARLARRLDAAAYGKSGLWGRVLSWLFGWRHDADTDENGQDTPADEAAENTKQDGTEQQAAPDAPAAEQVPQQPTEAPNPQHSQRRTAHTHTTTRRFPMSGSPLVIASAEMAAAASSYAPEDMWVVARDLDTLGEMPVNVATAVRVYTTRMEGEYPLHESVTEMLRQLHDGLAILGALADEIAVQFRAVHADDIKRDEAPRTNENLWNV